MASHVVVIDSAARRQTVKTNPGKYLSDILQEACKKFGVDSSQYALKHGNKNLDLSIAVRHSALTSGAKLNLVQASRSPSVVSVALQIHWSGNDAANSQRLVSKLPSSMSLWQILRQFEETIQPRLDLTLRSVPTTVDASGSGSGRLCYEAPVINLMGRTLSTFIDFQKSLAQLGINSGSAMLRLEFVKTQEPMEEALARMASHFDTKDAKTSPSAPAPSAMPNDPPVEEKLLHEVDSSSMTALAAAENGNEQRASLEETELDTSALVEPPVLPLTGSLSDSISIFAPPSSPTPAAASFSNHNESDYIPTIDHAKAHQALLNSESRNRKLLSDAELETRAQEKTKELTDIREVIVMIRFPDQSRVQRSFGQESTSRDLYSLCRELMERPNEETFALRAPNRRASIDSTIPDGDKTLIVGLGLQGRVLVTVVWGPDVPGDRNQKPSLKEIYRQKAQELKVDLPTAEEAAVDNKDVDKATVAQGTDLKKNDGGDREAKMKRFLGKLSKK